MEFPEKIHVELVPSAELEKIRVEMAAIDARSEARSDASFKLYHEVISLIADLRTEIKKLKIEMEELKQ